MKFLFLLTKHGRFDELTYASCVARKFAEEIKKKHTVIMVEDPDPKTANLVIKRYRPDVVWWVGHGNPNTTTLKDVAVWIQAPEYNTDILNGVIACAMSCLTARVLGKYVTKNKKCKYYVGYNDVIWFNWCNDEKYFNCACSGRNPYQIRQELWKNIIECVFDANLYFVKGLSDGKSVEDAYKMCYDRYNYWIDYFDNVETEGEHEFAIVRVTVWSLKHDRDALRLLGGDVVSAGVNVKTYRKTITIYENQEVDFGILDAEKDLKKDIYITWDSSKTNIVNAKLRAYWYSDNSAVCCDVYWNNNKVINMYCGTVAISPCNISKEADITDMINNGENRVKVATYKCPCWYPYPPNFHTKISLYLDLVYQGVMPESKSATGNEIIDKISKYKNVILVTAGVIGGIVLLRNIKKR